MKINTNVADIIEEIKENSNDWSLEQMHIPHVTSNSFEKLRNHNQNSKLSDIEIVEVIYFILINYALAFFIYSKAKNVIFI